MTNTTWFWVVGLFLTGLTLVIIGMLLGQIGQAARRAELPPSEVVTAESRIQQTAAANPTPAVVTPSAAAISQPTMANPPIVIGR